MGFKVNDFPARLGLTQEIMNVISGDQNAPAIAGDLAGVL